MIRITVPDGNESRPAAPAAPVAPVAPVAPALKVTPVLPAAPVAPAAPAVGSAVTAAISIWERMYEDEEGKNIEIIGSDGSVRVHSCFLRSMSEPLKCMLDSGLAEAQAKQIKMHDLTAAQLKFILRLAYTGHVEPSEWNAPPQRDEADAIPPGNRVPHTVREKITVDVISQGATFVTAMWTPHTFSAHMNGWCKRAGIPLSDASILFEGQKLDPQGTPGKLGWRKSMGAMIIHIEPAGSLMAPPLELLFGCASFAKKYSIVELLPLVLERLKAQLNVKDFDKIMCFAIAHDLSPLKLHGILYAKGNPELRSMFDQHRLSPEVEFELQAIWSADSAGAAKKRRTL